MTNRNSLRILITAGFGYFRLPIMLTYLTAAAVLAAMLLSDRFSFETIYTVMAVPFAVCSMYIALTRGQEKQDLAVLCLPVSLRRIGLSRLVFPLLFLLIGIAVLWLTALIIRPALASPNALERSARLLYHLMFLNVYMLIIIDLKQHARGGASVILAGLTIVMLLLLHIALIELHRIIKYAADFIGLDAAPLASYFGYHSLWTDAVFFTYVSAVALFSYLLFVRRRQYQ